MVVWQARVGLRGHAGHITAILGDPRSCLFLLAALASYISCAGQGQATLTSYISCDNLPFGSASPLGVCLITYYGPVLFRVDTFSTLAGVQLSWSVKDVLAYTNTHKWRPARCSLAAM